jgi:hypothetical protein
MPPKCQEWAEPSGETACCGAHVKDQRSCRVMQTAGTATEIAANFDSEVDCRRVRDVAERDMCAEEWGLRKLLIFGGDISAPAVAI